VSYPLINGAVINGDDEGALASSGLSLVSWSAPTMYAAVPAPAQDPSLEISDGGAIKLGVDVAATPYDGIDLCRNDGLPWVFYGQPPADMTFAAPSDTALEFGDASARSDVSLGAPTAQALGLGRPSVQTVLCPATAGTTLELGEPGPSATALFAGGFMGLEFGEPLVSWAHPAAGFDLARWTPPTVRFGGSSFPAPTAQALEFGAPGMPLVALSARPASALEFGRAAIGLGSTC
jgi:hypothetical protein